MFFCHYKCHTERSEVSLLMYGFEILHICYSLRSSKTSLIFTLRNGQNDKFAYCIDQGATAMLSLATEVLYCAEGKYGFSREGD